MNRLRNWLYHRFLCAHCARGGIPTVVGGSELHIYPKRKTVPLSSTLTRVL